jgi:hypothetical protein
MNIVCFFEGYRAISAGANEEKAGKNYLVYMAQNIYLAAVFL